MRILISAAETSSDAHGAELLKAIRESLPPERKLEAFGIGGPKLKSAGLNVLVDARELLAMGFLEILGHLPKILKALRRVSLYAKETRPDVAVVIDYPDFHFRLARRLRSFGIPVVYYIPPKVWAWRKGRVETLRSFFEKILCIFPFEEEFYKDQRIPAVYVGNPLLDELPLSLSRSEARAALALKATDKVVVLMPGSRAAELKHHLEILLESAQVAAGLLRSSGVLGAQEPLRVLLPFPVTAQLEALKERVERFLTQSGQNSLDIRVSQGNAPECLVAADAGLIKSGTSTLEAGMLRCPHAVIYKTNRVTGWIVQHLIRYRGPVGLVNLVAGWKPGEKYLVEEFLLKRVNPSALGNELVDLMIGSEKRQRQFRGFDQLISKMEVHRTSQSPSARAAVEVLQVIEERQKQLCEASF